jgi:hypothetical protein
MKRSSARELAFGSLSLAAGLFGIPAIVLTGEMLIISGILAVVAIASGLAVMRSKTSAVRALSIAGFIIGVLTLWYVITGLALGWSIGTVIESFF